MISIGQTVRLKDRVKEHTRCPEGRDNNETANVKYCYDDGSIYTDRDLHGCRYWHEFDVEIIHQKGIYQ